MWVKVFSDTNEGCNTDQRPSRYSYELNKPSCGFRTGCHRYPQTLDQNSTARGVGCPRGMNEKLAAVRKVCIEILLEGLFVELSWNVLPALIDLRRFRVANVIYA